MARTPNPVTYVSSDRTSLRNQLQSEKVYPTSRIALSVGPLVRNKISATLYIAAVYDGVMIMIIRDIYTTIYPEIGLSVQWNRTNQSVAVCGSLW